MSVPRQSSILQSTEFQRSEARATRLQSRSLQKPTPELHILGEICGGTGFGEGVHVACKWALEAGDKFELIEGSIGGQTQVDCGESGSDAVVWSHPIDAHYMAGALQGWPRILIQVWRLDDVGRLEVEGYGFVHVPTSPGTHELSVPTWRPVGTQGQEMAAYFLGGVPKLKSTAVLFTAAHEQRFRHVTSSSGTVHIRLELLHRHYDKEGLEPL